MSNLIEREREEMKLSPTALEKMHDGVKDLKASKYKRIQSMVLTKNDLQSITEHKGEDDKSALDMLHAEDMAIDHEPFGNGGFRHPKTLLIRESEQTISKDLGSMELLPSFGGSSEK
jgi:hypothetical protein